jgi:hypothetical protein
MDYSTFNSLPYPEIKDIVYVIGVSTDSDFHPFYVGQSSRNIGRFGDYISAKFSAATDFKVGQAIEFLTNNGFKVEFKYRSTLDRLMEEKELINSINPILNTIKGYDYKNSDYTVELRNIQEFLQKWIDSSFTLNLNDVLLS